MVVVSREDISNCVASYIDSFRGTYGNRRFSHSAPFSLFLQVALALLGEFPVTQNAPIKRKRTEAVSGKTTAHCCYFPPPQLPRCSLRRRPTCPTARSTLEGSSAITHLLHKRILMLRPNAPPPAAKQLEAVMGRPCCAARPPRTAGPAERDSPQTERAV